MRYLCLVYYDEAKLDTLTASAYDALVAETLAYDEELWRSGHYLSSGALESVQSAATVRVGSGRMSVTDGPFAETREQLGGYLLIEARDLNEAIRMASRMPPARMGCIEVRPIKALTPCDGAAEGPEGQQA